MPPRQAHNPFQKEFPAANGVSQIVLKHQSSPNEDFLLWGGSSSGIMLLLPL